MYIPSDDYSAKKEQKSNSLIIGVLILVISLILIGLYLVNWVLKWNINKNNAINNTIANNAWPGWQIWESVTFSWTLTPRNDQPNFFQFWVKELDYIWMSSQKVNMSGLSWEFVFQWLVKDIKQFSWLINTYIIDVSDIKPILAKSLDSSTWKLVATIWNKSVVLNKDIILADPSYNDQDWKLIGWEFELDTFLCSESSPDPTKNCDKMKENESVFTNLQWVDFFRPLESSKYYFYTPRYWISFVSDDEQKAQDFANSIDIIDENYISQIISDHISSVCNDWTTKIVRKETLSYDPIKSQLKINGFDQSDNLVSCIVSLEVQWDSEKKLVFDFQSFWWTNTTASSISSTNEVVVTAPTIYSSRASVKQVVSSQTSISSQVAIDLNANSSSTTSTTNSISTTSSQWMNIDLNATSSVSSSSSYKDEKIISWAVTYSQYRSAQRGYTATFPRNFVYQVAGAWQAVSEWIYCYNSITLSNYNTQANWDDIRILACNWTWDANAYAASKWYRLYRAWNNVFFASALTNDWLQALSNISFK